MVKEKGVVELDVGKYYYYYYYYEKRIYWAAENNLQSNWLRL